ncbi:MAG TPA: hypothetical protein VIU40_04175 [Geobacteraceae bacterium]
METPRDDAAPALRLDLGVSPELVREFFTLLQQGVTVAVRVGCTLAELLAGEFGLDEAYVEQRITTIFLDSKPVDDVHRATVRERSTLALSGAMPGLVGATMRRGGYYAAMRGAISHREGGGGAQGYGTVRLKLFNLLLPELGPAFLRRGVIVATAELVDLFNGVGEAFWPGCRARLDGTPVDPELLRSGVAFAGYGSLLLRVDYGE